MLCGRVLALTSLLVGLLAPSAFCTSHLQAPDPNGWAVKAYGISDDWISPFTGPVTEIKIWLATRADGATGFLPELFAAGYSFIPGAGARVTGRRLPNSVDQGFYSIPGGFQRQDHTGLLELSFIPDVPPLVEKGQRDTIILGLVISSGADVGWSTSSAVVGQPARYELFNGTEGTLTNPLTGHPMDMAFEILPEPGSLVLLAIAGAPLLIRRCANSRRSRQWGKTSPVIDARTDEKRAGRDGQQ